ncbi:MAG: neutral/alkaline non-lysosomal ceramidase N-terminal domain-containing protein [Deltaproteobacteria bacterium]|nr:neutral/alkaline non-lysosomal ceramidase N-terminal domain-containing protein [Deltaproteobacteria bacterium]
MTSPRARVLPSLLLSVCALATGTLIACSSEDPTPPAQTCAYHEDCAGGGVCFRGQCYGTATCFDRGQCTQVPVCEGGRCICPDEVRRCLPVCTYDDECSADGQCLNGVCTPYGPQFLAPAPGGGAKKPLEVGIGQVYLDFPVGVSLAAYGNRRGPNTPYQGSLGGSNGWFDRPDVRALAFDDGEELFVLLRLPLGWTTDEMLTETALKVQQRTGLNLLNRIVTSATHSHSEPARWWHLVVGLNFGIFGYDEFNYEIFDRVTTSFADAVVMALETRAPARFGWTVIDDFDPTGNIHHDRRERNNGLPGYRQVDDRLFILRVDDMSGAPVAVLAHLGLHGTLFSNDNPIITGDAPGGIEEELTRLASAKYQREVLGIFLQGNAGDVSPAGGPYGHTLLEQLQRIGVETWKLIEPKLDAIETKSDIEVDVVTGRVPIGHDVLYGPGEFRDKNVTCEDTPDYFRYGAFQCTEGYLDDEDPATMFTDGDLKCVFGVECLTTGYPVPQFQKTVLSVARLGDLLLPTMPGEPLSEFGLQVAERVKAAVPGVRDAFVLGYSQDHHFYLTTEADFLQGGYEPSRAIWGWKMAPYFADKSVELAQELTKPAAERAWDNGNLKPMSWPVSEEDRVRVAPTETAGDPAGVKTDVPERVERLEVVTFAWNGGHPGIDQPRITLEREDGTGSGFVDVERPGGWAYNDASFEMLVRYDGKCTKRNCQDHAWRVEWEDTREFPAGRYRFRAEGHALKGGQVVEYTARSRTFTLAPSRKLSVYGLDLAADGIEGRVVEPRRVAFEADGDQQVATPIGHLLRSSVVPAAVGVPLPMGLELEATGTVRNPAGTEAPIRGRATVTAMADEPRQIVARIDAAGLPQVQATRPYATSHFRLALPAISAGASGAYLVRLTLTDPSGNSGTVTATVSKP